MTPIDDPERVSSHTLLKMRLSTLAKSLPYTTSSRKTWTIYTRWLDLHRQNPSKFTENWSQSMMVWVQSLNARGFEEQEIRDEVGKWKEREYPHGHARGGRSLPKNQDITNAFDDKERQHRLKLDRQRKGEALTKQDSRRYEERPCGPDIYRPQRSSSEAPSTPRRRGELFTSLAVSRQHRKNWVDEFGHPPPGDYVCNRCNNPGHHLQLCPTNMDPTRDRPPPRDYQCELCNVSGLHWKSLCPINIDPMSIIQKRRAAGVTTPTKSSRRQAHFDPNLERVPYSRDLYLRVSSAETHATIEREQNYDSYQPLTRGSSTARYRDEKQTQDSVYTNRANCQHCNSCDHRSESCQTLSESSFSTYRSPRKDAEYGRLSKFADSYDEDPISASSPADSVSNKRACILANLHKIEEDKEGDFDGEDVTMDIDSLVTNLGAQSFKIGQKRVRSPSSATTTRVDFRTSAVNNSAEHVHKKMRVEIGEADPPRYDSWNSDIELDTVPCQMTKFVVEAQCHAGQYFYVDTDREDMEVEYDETEGLYDNNETYFIANDHLNVDAGYQGYDTSERALDNGFEEKRIIDFGEIVVNRRTSIASILGTIPEEIENCLGAYDNRAIDRLISTEAIRGLLPEVNKYGFGGYDGAVDRRASATAIQSSGVAEEQAAYDPLEIEDMDVDIVVPCAEKDYCSAVKQLRKTRPEFSEVVNSPRRMTAAALWGDGVSIRKAYENSIAAM